MPETARNRISCLSLPARSAGGISGSGTMIQPRGSMQWNVGYPLVPAKADDGASDSRTPTIDRNSLEWIAADVDLSAKALERLSVSAETANQTIVDAAGDPSSQKYLTRRALEDYRKHLDSCWQSTACLHRQMPLAIDQVGSSAETPLSLARAAAGRELALPNYDWLRTPSFVRFDGPAVSQLRHGSAY